MSFWDDILDKPMLIGAHRGAKSLRAENTLGAFEDAIGRSDFIELDVGFSKDGVAIVIHDDTLNRTSNIQSIKKSSEEFRVVDFTYDELLELDFGSWFKSGDLQKIPTLKEVLLLIKKHKFPINIELKDMSKTPFDEVAPKKVLNEVLEVGVEDLVLFSSFNHNYIKELSKLSPKIKRAILKDKSHPKNIISYMKECSAHGYHCSLDIVSKELVLQLQKENYFVSVYTVNHAADKEKVLKMGVNAIFTDFL